LGRLRHRYSVPTVLQARVHWPPTNAKRSAYIANLTRDSPLSRTARMSSAKALKAQLSIAYTTGEMPFESRDFMPNEFPQRRMSV
jgi:hypothetical protein